MMEPGIGRIVHFRPAGHAPDAQPCAAIVVGITDARCINLAIFDHEGHQYHGTDVQLLQDDDAPPADRGYAEWMPFQKGQAAKTEAAQGDVAKQVTDLAADVDAKFKSLGDWLQPALDALGKRIDAMAQKPADTPPQPAPDAAAAQTAS